MTVVANYVRRFSVFSPGTAMKRTRIVTIGLVLLALASAVVIYLRPGEQSVERRQDRDPSTSEHATITGAPAAGAADVEAAETAVGESAAVAEQLDAGPPDRDLYDMKSWDEAKAYVERTLPPPPRGQVEDDGGGYFLGLHRVLTGPLTGIRLNRVQATLQPIGDSSLCRLHVDAAPRPSDRNDPYYEIDMHVDLPCAPLDRLAGTCFKPRSEFENCRHPLARAVHEAFNLRLAVRSEVQGSAVRRTMRDDGSETDWRLTILVRDPAYLVGVVEAPVHPVAHCGSERSVVAGLFRARIVE